MGLNSEGTFGPGCRGACCRDVHFLGQEDRI